VNANGLVTGDLVGLQMKTEMDTRAVADRELADEAFRSLAQLRHMCADTVATTRLKKRAHVFALHVWRHIERRWPSLTPTDWLALHGGASASEMFANAAVSPVAREAQARDSDSAHADGEIKDQ
jgi:hypothetical protein